MNINEIKKALKAQGINVTRANANVNGKPAYKVEGKFGLFTKNGLLDLVF